MKKVLNVAIAIAVVGTLAAMLLVYFVADYCEEQYIKNEKLIALEAGRDYMVSGVVPEIPDLHNVMAAKGYSLRGKLNAINFIYYGSSDSVEVTSVYYHHFMWFNYMKMLVFAFPLCSYAIFLGWKWNWENEVEDYVFC